MRNKVINNDVLSDSFSRHTQILIMGNSQSSQSGIVLSTILTQIARKGPEKGTIIRLTDKDGNVLLNYILVSIKEGKLVVVFCAISPNRNISIFELTESTSRSKNPLILSLTNSTHNVELDLYITKNDDHYRLTGLMNYKDMIVTPVICGHIKIQEIDNDFVLITDEKENITDEIQKIFNEGQNTFDGNWSNLNKRQNILNEEQNDSDEK